MYWKSPVGLTKPNQLKYRCNNYYITNVTTRNNGLRLTKIGPLSPKWEINPQVIYFIFTLIEEPNLDNGNNLSELRGWEHLDFEKFPRSLSGLQLLKKLDNNEHFWMFEWHQLW